MAAKIPTEVTVTIEVNLVLQSVSVSEDTNANGIQDAGELVLKTYLSACWMTTVIL